MANLPQPPSRANTPHDGRQAITKLLTQLREVRTQLAQALQGKSRIDTLGEKENWRVEERLRWRRTRKRAPLSAEVSSRYRLLTPERKEIERIRRSRQEAEARIAEIWRIMQELLDAYRSPQNAEVFKVLDRLSPQLGRDSTDRAISAVKRILVTEKQANELVGSAAIPAAGSPKELADERLLAGKPAVTFETAAAYLGVGDRQIRNLTKSRKVDIVGQGQHKKITTASLRRYKGSPLPKNSEPGGTERN